MPATLDWQRIAALRAGPIPDEDSILSDERVIGRAGEYAVIHAPFGSRPRPEAKVIFVGLTPGIQQLALAMRAARERQSLDPDVLSRDLRRSVAFAGQMRTNLISMLDRLELHSHLGIQSTSELFGPAEQLLFATSALLYPVLYRGRNYSGNPAIVREPLFIDMLESLLGPTLAKMPAALVIPFGRWANQAVLFLAERGFFDQARVLRGFPHPSGANGHRASLFQRNAADMREQLNRWFKPTR